MLFVIRIFSLKMQTRFRSQITTQDFDIDQFSDFSILKTTHQVNVLLIMKHFN